MPRLGEISARIQTGTRLVRGGGFAAEGDEASENGLAGPSDLLWLERVHCPYAGCKYSPHPLRVTWQYRSREVKGREWRKIASQWAVFGSEWSGSNGVEWRVASGEWRVAKFGILVGARRNPWRIEWTARETETQVQERYLGHPAGCKYSPHPLHFFIGGLQVQPAPVFLASSKYSPHPFSWRAPSTARTREG